MTTAAIRKKLHNYIETAKDKKVKAIYAMVEEEINEVNEPWSDEFVTELEKRVKDFESGKVKGKSWEEVKKKSKQLIKAKNNR